MTIHLPDPVPARVESVDGNAVTFRLPDALHAFAFQEMFKKALAGDYAVRISLIQYEGHPTMHEQGEARKARKARKADE